MHASTTAWTICYIRSYCHVLIKIGLKTQRFLFKNTMGKTKDFLLFMVNCTRLLSVYCVLHMFFILC